MFDLKIFADEFQTTDHVKLPLEIPQLARKASDDNYKS